MKTLRIAALVLILATVSFGATFPVNPSGDCNTDIFNIAFIIDNIAVPGDTIQLGPGEFNFTCMPEVGGGPLVHVANLTFAGTPGQTIIRGPGLFDDSGTPAFFIGAGGDGVRFTDLKFTDFVFAIFGGQNRRNIAITNSTFDQVINAIHISRLNEGVRILHNVINMPASPFDPSTGLAGGIAIFAGFHNDNLLIADNVITGPGNTLKLRKVQDITSPDLAIFTSAIFESDSVPPAATFGRISNNVISGFDLAIQSSSNFGVVSNNKTTACGFGIVVSNDTGDGVTTVNNNIVTGNDVRGNQVGIWMASATNNVISLNDARDNSVVGLVLLGNVNGATSDDNTLILNTGSKSGLPGNHHHKWFQWVRD